MDNIAQKRARCAYYFVQEAVAKEIIDKYCSLTQKLPQLILKNGISATIAYLKSKNKDEHNLLLKHLEGFCKKNLVAIRMQVQKDKLLEAVIKLDPQKYRALTDELLMLANWLKRLASGEKKKKTSPEDTHNEQEEDLPNAQ